MKPVYVLPALAAIALLGGCIIVDADEGDISASVTDDSRVGTVFAAAVHQNRVSFRVTSNGCTDKTYFDTDVDERSGDRFIVSIDRTKRDMCRAFLPEGVELSYSFAELGLPDGADVTILNRVRRR